MEKTTFVTWLNKEVASSSCALLKLYEELDKLKLFMNHSENDIAIINKGNIDSYESTKNILITIEYIDIATNVKNPKKQNHIDALVYLAVLTASTVLCPSLLHP